MKLKELLDVLHDDYSIELKTENNERIMLFNNNVQGEAIDYFDREVHFS